MINRMKFRILLIYDAQLRDMYILSIAYRLHMLLFTPFVIGLLYIFAQQYTSFKDTDKDNMVVRNNFC